MLLTQAKVTRVRTVMEPLDIDSKTLQVERVDAVNEDADTRVPFGPGDVSCGVMVREILLEWKAF